MRSSSDSALMLFPGALGDFICFLPTVAALRARHAGRLCVVTQPMLHELMVLPDSDALSIHRREVANLFSTDPAPAADTHALLGGFARGYSWTGCGDANFARRLAHVTGGCVDVYPFRGMRPAEHAVDYYARCVEVEPRLLPSTMIADDPQWFTDFGAHYGLTAGGFVVMHPGSGAREKNWEGFESVAQHWRMHHGGPIVVLHGPVEMERRPAPIADTVVVEDLSLRQVAALLRRCRLYLGNDSGVSHLAGAVGARGVAVFGPTDPGVWAPRGERLKVLHAPERCERCGAGRLCSHRVTPEAVIAALERLIESNQP